MKLLDFQVEIFRDAQVLKLPLLPIRTFHPFLSKLLIEKSPRMPELLKVVVLCVATLFVCKIAVVNFED